MLKIHRELKYYEIYPDLQFVQAFLPHLFLYISKETEQIFHTKERTHFKCIQFLSNDILEK